MEKAKRQIQVLARRFSHESDFKTALLEFNWQSQADDSPTDTISGLLGSIEEFEAQGVLNVSPCTVDQQFAACLENLVPMIQRSNTRKAPISMQGEYCTSPSLRQLFQVWQPVYNHYLISGSHPVKGYYLRQGLCQVSILNLSVDYD